MTKEKILQEQIKELEKLLELKDKRIKELELNPREVIKYVPYTPWIQPLYPTQPYYPFWTVSGSTTTIKNTDNLTLTTASKSEPVDFTKCHTTGYVHVQPFKNKDTLL